MPFVPYAFMATDQKRADYYLFLPASYSDHLVTAINYLFTKTFPKTDCGQSWQETGGL